jgi:hypothetical protein
MLTARPGHPAEVRPDGFAHLAASPPAFTLFPPFVAVLAGPLRRQATPPGSPKGKKMTTRVAKWMGT